MSKLSKIEEKINRLIDKCRRLEAELDQGVFDFSKVTVDRRMEDELAILKKELAKKDDKLRRVSARMEKLQSLVKSL